MTNDIGYIDVNNGKRIPVSTDRPLPVVPLSGGVTTPGSGPSTGTRSDVAASASDGTILAADPLTKSYSVVNESTTATLYLLESTGTSSATNYSVALPPGAYWSSNYTGIVKGIWSAASGNARVTKYT